MRVKWGVKCLFAIAAVFSVMMVYLIVFSPPASVEADYNELAVWDFAYTGAVQTFTAPADGRYRLETWGASGGTVARSGFIDPGKGGYSSGELTLNAGDTLYVYVGGQGVSDSGYGKESAGGWNGGGRGKAGNSGWSASGGGGATDIRTVNGAWNDASSLNSRILVAGGGGGTAVISPSYAMAIYLPTTGDGGGLSGINGGILLAQNVQSTTSVNGKAGTQTNGGDKGTNSLGVNSNGGFGFGGNSADYGGGGGGGYYGGGGGGAVPDVVGSGGGGSGYIGGVVNGQTIAGDTVFVAPDATTETGHTGDGFARITLLCDGVCVVEVAPAVGGDLGGDAITITGGGSRMVRLSPLTMTGLRPFPVPTLSSQQTAKA